MNDESTDMLRRILKNASHSLTQPRLLVCEALAESGPVSMRELCTAVEDEIDRATVYRTIELFEKLGLVERIYIGWKYKVELSDVLSHHHHHLACTNCGRLIAMSDEADIERLIDAIARRHGFRQQQHQLEVRGICADCSKKHAS